MPFKVPYKSIVLLNVCIYLEFTTTLSSAVDRVFRPDPGPMSTLQKSVGSKRMFLEQAESNASLRNVLISFVSSSSIGRRYPRRRSLLCFLLFILLVSSTVGLMVRLLMSRNVVMLLEFFLKSTCSSSGWFRWARGSRPGTPRASTSRGCW